MIEIIKNWSRDFGATVQIVTSIAQLLLALVLYWITREYVHYTNQIVQAQIPPSVSLDNPNSMVPKLVVTNDGAQPVTNLRIAVDELRFFETKSGPVGASRSAGKPVWSSPTLAAGDCADCLVDELARVSLITAENERRFWGENLARNTGGLLGADDVTVNHVFSFKLSFQRPVDKRRFEVEKQFLLAKVVGSGEPFFMPLRALSGIPTFKEYCTAKGIPFDPDTTLGGWRASEARAAGDGSGEPVL